MSVRDTLLGSATAYAIAVLTFLYSAVGEATGLVPTGSGATEFPPVPLLVSAYSAIVGTGLLVGAALLSGQRPER
jgi:hypothetical protein